MRIGTTTFARAAGILAIGLLGSAAGVLSTSSPAGAQIKTGEFWLIQPGQTLPVGRAWSDASRQHEYWAYVSGTYAFADSSNGPGNRWGLQAEYVSNADYPSFAAFKQAVLALPVMQGKTIIFQSHTCVEETYQN